MKKYQSEGMTKWEQEMDQSMFATIIFCLALFGIYYLFTVAVDFFIK